MPYGPGRLVGWSRIPPARSNLIRHSLRNNGFAGTDDPIGVIAFHYIGPDLCSWLYNISFWYVTVLANQRNLYRLIRNAAPDACIGTDTHLFIEDCPFHNCTTLNHRVSDDD